MIALLGATSCKNNYDCVCTWYNNNEEKTVTHAIGEMKEADAIFYCDQAQSDAERAMYLELTADTVKFCNLRKLD